MMHASKLRNIIAMFVASAAVSAQSDTSPVKTENRASPPDARQIMESSIAATERSWHARLHYTYIECDEDRRRDSAGHIKSEEIEVSKTILVNGVPFEQLVESNGRPLSVEQERKQKDKLDKLKRETPEERAERLHEQEDENTSLVGEIPRAFDFQLVGEVNSRRQVSLCTQATPHPGVPCARKVRQYVLKSRG
jgi:hypothetical protein